MMTTSPSLSLCNFQGADYGASSWELTPRFTTETLYQSDRLQPDGLGEEWEIYVSGFDAILARDFGDRAAALIRHYTARYSRFSRDSVVCRINDAAGVSRIEVDAETGRLFALADRVYALTRGIIDPTMLPLLRLWNYRPVGMSRPSSTEVSVALGRIGWTRVQRERGRIFLPEVGMCIDLDAIVSRHLVDRVAELGLEMGVENFLIKHGRDMRSNGAPMGAECWFIGVEDPDYAGLVGRQVRLNSCGASSCGHDAGLESRRGRGCPVVVDPRSGFPVDNSCLQVSVVAKSCLEAGLLSTTAFTLGADQGMNVVERYFGAEGVMSCRGRDEIRTAGSDAFFE